MSLTSYRAAPPRGKTSNEGKRVSELKGGLFIRSADLAATYSPAP